MGMKSAFNQLLETVDHFLLAPIVGHKPPPLGHGFVTAFLFHRLFPTNQISSFVYPHERTTLSFFESFLIACKQRGVQFITPKDIIEGKHIGHHNVMLTFDDGYADNILALPVLEAHQAKATFFVAPAHIVEQRRFWCDAVWCNGERNLSYYQNLTHQQAANEIEQKWPGSLNAPSPDDRPLTLDEFKQLTGSDLVEIGHHSYNHTILHPRPKHFVLDELDHANDFFQKHTGLIPLSIAYPNGVYSDTLVNTCSEHGFQVAFTCEPRTELLGSNPPASQLMRMGRYAVYGSRAIAPQVSSALLLQSCKKSVYQLKRGINRLTTQSPSKESQHYGA